MRVYISGPITGTTDYMERFQEAEENLRKEGLIPYNPAAVNSMMPKETTYEEYMKVAFVLLDMCEAIHLLPGWKNSTGANREYGYALGKGKIILSPPETERPGRQYEASAPELAVGEPEYTEEEPKFPPPEKPESEEVMPPAVKTKKEICLELKEQGMSVKEIRDKTGISYNTVYYYFTGGRSRYKRAPGHNADRHLCKTCQYRGKKGGCDYCIFTDEERGCDPADCDKYKEGDRLECKD